MKRLGMHRVDGRSFWFGGYFNAFDRDRMIRHAGAVRADRFAETFGGRVPLAGARIVSVFDPDPAAAAAFGETFGVPPAASPDVFAEGLDGVIVPFPAGGPARDYGAVAPLADRGIGLFLDRVILEQADALDGLCRLAAGRRAPLHISSFMRYLAELLRPSPSARVEAVEAEVSGEPAGYGADLLDLVDELMQGEPRTVINEGGADADVLRIGYADGRSAVLRLLRTGKRPAAATASGAGWVRSLVVDGSQNHLGAYRQFEAFVRALDTREPPVPYKRVLANAAILRFAERREFGREFRVATPA